MAFAGREVDDALEWCDGHSIGFFVEHQFEPTDFAPVDETDAWAGFSFRMADGS